MAARVSILGFPHYIAYIAPNSDYDCCRFSEVQTNVKERVPKMAEAGGSAGCEYEEEGYDGGWEEEEIEEKVV